MLTRIDLQHSFNLMTKKLCLCVGNL